MQVIETKADGLKRQYRVTVEAREIEEKIEQKLESLRGTVKMKGFRPGHVPKNLLRKMYGESLTNEVRMDTIQDSVRNALESQAVRPALQPQIDNLSGGTDGEDLAFDLNVEVLPKVEAPDFSTLEVEKPVAQVDEESIDEALQRLAEQQKSFEPRPAGEAAQSGDRVTLDIEVHSGEERIDTLSGEDISVVLGSTYVMPGLSEKLEGATEGEERTFDLTLPEQYPLEKLRGQSVAVRARVKQVAAPKVPEVDEELAKGIGFEDLEGLRNAVRGRIENDFQAASRAKVKRALLDSLDDMVQFEVPEGMVEQEFQGLWAQAHPEEARGQAGHDHDHGDDHDHAHHDHAHHDHDHTHDHEHDHGHGEAEAAAQEVFPPAGAEPESEERQKEREELRRIAERRVRLGLLLAEVGQSNQLNVTQDEINRAVMDQARSMPGREKIVFDFYKNRPEALNQLVAPILEEKVVDFILELAKVSEREVSREELFRDPNDEETEEQAATA